MKIIFLDVDGVLNFESTEARSPTGVFGVASQPLVHLRSIVKATGAFIVLSSTWRREWDREEEGCGVDAKYLVRRLKREGLHIMDKTVGNGRGCTRGAEIREWLDRHKGVESWVVIDDEVFDDYKENGILPHLVQTNFYTDGLNERLAGEAIKILNGGEEDAKAGDYSEN